jgi:hypothetical protein
MTDYGNTVRAEAYFDGEKLMLIQNTADTDAT